MQYNGKELKEANGADYQLSTTPKNMLVWDNDSNSASILEVYGYVNCCWLVKSLTRRTGVSEYDHAAEIPTETETRATNRELARWLAQGNGEVLGSDRYAKTSLNYTEECSNIEVCEERKVRKWDDDTWHSPTREYLGLEDN